MVRWLVVIVFALVLSGCATILGLDDAVVDEPDANPAEDANDAAIDAAPMEDSTVETAIDAAEDGPHRVRDATIDDG